VLITLLTPISTPGAEILSRTCPNILDHGIAVVSGIAGAYAYAREKEAKTLADVAIAVALVPPLAVAGIGIGWAEWNVFFGATLLLTTNLAGIVLAAALTFMFLGFSPFRLASKGMLISLKIVAILSIPLALGFTQMVSEHKIIQQIENLETKDSMIRDVQVLRLSALKLSLKIVSSVPPGDEEIKEIKNQVEERLGKKVELEIINVMVR
jgi:uncharacterized membrane protein